MRERSYLRPLPEIAFDTDEIVSAIVTSHARVSFDGNRYSVPPEVARKAVVLRVNADRVRVLYEGREIARHQRSYGP